MDLRNKILRAINKGLNEALDLDDVDEDDDLKIQKKSLRQTIQNSNHENNKLYYQDQMNKIMSKETITREDIEQCIEWCKEYNIQYNPHLDGAEFKNFIQYIIVKSYNNINLNWIDTSEVTNMHRLFYYFDFNGDISMWDVSNVFDMQSMFEGTSFNEDISQWDVSNVKNMRCMFHYSLFNSNISNWDVSNVTDMEYMFYASKFNQDISMWNINNNCITSNMFEQCPIKNEYKP